ncbi:MAG: putative amidase AmiD [Alphaproteobacteria bacterium MarineAlpha3_Bin5]|nr:amidase [Magnetovibrio sp.]PPR75728.1 MAG: putative amidase AmiD [Alphaproteobacteria bacterium MarineAlpha3_Bin5]
MNIAQEPNELTATDALHCIKSGKFSSKDLIESCLSRIEEREPLVGAWQFLSRSHALEAADASDKSANRGKIQGIPIGIKDIFDTADMPTEYGSPIYKGNIPKSDASSVAQIKGEGGIILGKTVTTEFAYFNPGKTINPHNAQHTPGGSSSGSAAAVADFMVPLALGSQTVGSTIRPASYCGIVGYKPSFGLIDRTGVRTLAETFDTIGIFSRTVADAAYLASIIGRRPSLQLKGPASAPVNIGICQTPEWSAADENSRAAFSRAADLADNAGVNIKEITLSGVFDALASAQALITDFEAASSAAYELTYHRNKVSSRYIEKAEIGLSCTEQQYDDALLVVLAAQAEYSETIKEVNVLICPSATGEAPKGLEFTGDPILNRLGTALKVPCINVPGLTGKTGLPVGVQAIGGFKQDAETLVAASWLQEILKVA